MIAWPRRSLTGCAWCCSPTTGCSWSASRSRVAWYDLYFFERACMAQVLAASTGQPLRHIAAEDGRRWPPKQFEHERDRPSVFTRRHAGSRGPASAGLRRG